MIVLMIARPSSNMDQAGLESRSLGQILEKSCLHSVDHIYGSIFMKLCQNDCLDDILAKFEYESYGVKN